MKKNIACLNCGCVWSVAEDMTISSCTECTKYSGDSVPLQTVAHPPGFLETMEKHLPNLIKKLDDAESKEEWWLEHADNIVYLSHPKDAEKAYRRIRDLILEARRREREAIVEELNKLVFLQGSSCPRDNGYHDGMYNGLECAAAVIEKRQPNYINSSNGFRL